MKFYSQCGQDEYFFNNFFKDKSNGVVVEVGAYDGVMFSNSYFFELLGWSTVCIEPNPDFFDKITQIRKGFKYNCAVSDVEGKTLEFLSCTGYTSSLSGLIKDYDPRHIQRIDREISQYGGSKKVIEVKTRTLTSILDECGLIDIDICSIDTEGNEIDVLKGLDFSKFNISFFTIENNYNTNEIKNYLISRGYQYLISLGADEIFQKVN